MLAAPWVTAVEKELAGVGLYCPVWSLANAAALK